MDAQLDGMVAAVGVLGLVHVYRIVKIGDLLGWLPGRLSIEVDQRFRHILDRVRGPLQFLIEIHPCQIRRAGAQYNVGENDRQTHRTGCSSSC